MDEEIKRIEGLLASDNQDDVIEAGMAYNKLYVKFNEFAAKVNTAIDRVRVKAIQAGKLDSTKYELVDEVMQKVEIFDESLLSIHLANEGIAATNQNAVQNYLNKITNEWTPEKLQTHGILKVVYARKILAPKAESKPDNGGDQITK